MVWPLICLWEIFFIAPWYRRTHTIVWNHPRQGGLDYNWTQTPMQVSKHCSLMISCLEFLLWLFSMTDFVSQINPLFPKLLLFVLFKVNYDRSKISEIHLSLCSQIPSACDQRHATMPVSHMGSEYIDSKHITHWVNSLDLRRKFWKLITLLFILPSIQISLYFRPLVCPFLWTMSKVFGWF